MENQNNESSNKKSLPQKNFLRSFLLAHKKAIEYISTQNKSKPKQEITLTKKTQETRIAWTDKSIAVGTIVLAACTFILSGATIVLAIYTAGLFNDASSSSTLAKQTHQSDSTLAYRRFISDSELANKRFQNETATINKQIAIAGTGLQEQIKSLKETKTEFEKEHKAFLDIDKIRISGFDTTHHFYVTFLIEDLSSQPIYTDSIALRIYYGDSAKGTTQRGIVGRFESLKSRFKFSNGFMIKMRLKKAALAFRLQAKLIMIVS